MANLIVIFKKIYSALMQLNIQAIDLAFDVVTHDHMYVYGSYKTFYKCT